MKKRTLWIIIGIGVLFILTNPSQSDFRQFAEFKEGKEVRYTRIGYYLFFSTYSYKTSFSEKEYFGFMKSFYYRPLWDSEEEKDLMDQRLLIMKQEAAKASVDSAILEVEAAVKAAEAAQLDY